MPTLSVSGATAVEGSNLNFVVTMSETSLANVTVQYRILNDGTAVINNDFPFSSADQTFTLTIPAGSTSATISYSTTGGSVNEFDENITLELSDADGADLAGGEPVLTATGVILDDDGGTDRALFVSDPVILETDAGTTQAVFEIRLSEPFLTNTTLSYETADGTAINGQDYTGEAGIVTFLAGETVASVAIDVLGDTDIETLETFSLVVTPVAGIAGIEDVAGIASIVEDDGAGISGLPVISLRGGETAEGDGLTWTVFLSQPSPANVTLQYRIVPDGSAVLNSDFPFSSADSTFTLTIPAGETVGTITYSTTGGSVDEFDENVTLELSDPSGGVFAGGELVLTATGVIQDNDGGTDRALFVSDPTVLETDSGTTQAVFEIRLSEPFTTSVTLDYETADGTAIAGEDYTAASGSVTFLAGQTIASVVVDINGDTDLETLESFSLVVTPIAGITGISDVAGLASIVDDDSASASGLPVMTVRGGTTGEGDGLTWTVLLSEPSLATVTVQYRILADGAATLDSDFPFSSSDSVFTATIAAGQTVGTINYSTTGGSVDEFDENVTLELFNPNGAILSGVNPTLTSTGVIFDDDGGTDRALFVSDPTVLETDSGTTQAVFEVRLSEPFTTDVTLNYQTADGTAFAGEDYTAASGTVTFLAGQTVASVAVDVAGDTDVENLESFSLVVTPIIGISGQSDVAGIASIVDDDGAGATGLPIMSLRGGVTEEGDGLAWTVILSEPSPTVTTVQYRLVPDGSAIISNDFPFSSASQTFQLTIPAFQTVGVINYSTTGGSVDEFDENITLELLNVSGAILEGGQTTTSATGVILDDDGGTDRALFVSDPTVLETDIGQTRVVFEVRLSEPFSVDVTLDYTTSDGSAVAGRDYVANSGSITFLAGQTVASVAVDVIGDTSSEAVETFSLIVSPIVGITGITDIVGEARILNFVPPDTSGSAFDDTLIGSSVSEILRGLAGDDELIGRAGRDVLRGGTGDDRLEGGSSGDRLFGGAGIDTATYLTASAGVSLNLTAGIGYQGHANGDEFFSIENVVGSDFGDVLIGSAGDNVLYGGRRADELRGSAGDDILEGGGGGDIINGGSGVDTASFVTAGGAVAMNLTSGVGFGGNANGDTYIRIENILGSNFGDLLIGSSGDNVINGGRGADELRGSAGNDMIEGGGGGDIVNGGSGVDTATFTTAGGGVTLNLTTGVGTRGNATGDTYIRIENVLGSAHNDLIVGSSGDNVLQGWLGNDDLRGSAGDDILNGGQGNDSLRGGSGDDMFIFRANNGDDVIEDFSRARDTIAFRINGLEFDDLEIDNVAGNAVIDYGSGTIELEGLSATRVIEDMFDFG